MLLDMSTRRKQLVAETLPPERQRRPSRHPIPHPHITRKSFSHLPELRVPALSEQKPDNPPSPAPNAFPDPPLVIVSGYGPNLLSLTASVSAARQPSLARSTSVEARAAPPQQQPNSVAVQRDAERTSGCRFPVYLHPACTHPVRPQVFKLVGYEDGSGGVRHEIEKSAFLEPLPWGWLSYWDEGRKKYVYHNWNTNMFSEVKPALPCPPGVSGAFQVPVEDGRWWNGVTDDGIGCKLDEDVASAQAKALEVYINSDVRHSSGKLSVFMRGLYGDDMKRWAAQMERIARDAKVCGRKKFPPLRMTGGCLPGLGGMEGGDGGQMKKRIERRALLIACEYRKEDRGNYTAEVDLPTFLPWAVRKDLPRLYWMLVEKRGFAPEEIFVLTDADRGNEEARAIVEKIEDNGTLIEYSSARNIVKAMGGLTANLKDRGSDVCTSLVFAFCGHGSSRPEFGWKELQSWTPDKLMAKATESNWRDEYMMASDYHRVWLGRPSSACDRDDNILAERRRRFVDINAVVDDSIQAILVAKVYEVKFCQLLMIIDCCESGTLADLPFMLDKQECWRSSGAVRKTEVICGSRHWEWDCGEGVVIAFSAARDGEAAMDHQGGFLTTAILESGLAKPPSVDKPLTILSVFRDIQRSIDNQSEQWKQIQCTQVPVLSCSHFPSLLTPIHF